MVTHNIFIFLLYFVIFREFSYILHLGGYGRRRYFTNSIVVIYYLVRYVSFAVVSCVTRWPAYGLRGVAWLGQ